MVSDAYMQAWYSLGLLDPMHAADDEYFNDDERRYAAFRESISRRTVTLAELSPLTALIEMEPNLATKDAMYRLIIQVGSDEVLHQLIDTKYRPFIEEEIALRSLRKPLNHPDVAELAKLPSKKVQTKILEMDDIAPSALEVLALEGVTRAIRNQAHNRLGRKGSAST
jgi:hypothetical protein